MLKDTLWGLALVACVLVTLYIVDLGVTAWREFNNPLIPKYSYYKSNLRSNETDGLNPLTEHAFSASFINESDIRVDLAAGNEEVTETDDTASSPYGYYKSNLRSNETDGLNPLTEHAFSATFINESDIRVDLAAGNEEVTETDDTASSPYLFQPIRYMNKEKRSVYREYQDG